MESVTLELPAMYGDHHVLAVRQILLGLEGVSDVWASATWRSVKVTFDPGKISAEQINKRLDEEGYMQPADTPVLEPAANPTQRFTTAFVEAGKQVSFAPVYHMAESRPLYPCPGMTPTPKENLE
jgi:hypothetical protein